MKPIQCPLPYLIVLLVYEGLPLSAQSPQPDWQQAVEKREIVIWSDGTRMVGDLYLPKERAAGQTFPAIIYCNGTGGTRRGAARFCIEAALQGFVTLGFDYRGWGDSESQLMAVAPQPKPDENGEMTIKVKAIRWPMNYTDQTEDIRAAISFLAGEPSVDSKRIGLFGTSYGGGLATVTAGLDPRVQCLVAQVPGMAGTRGQGAYKLHISQARGEAEPIPIETGKFSGKMARYDQMRVNPAKSIPFSSLEAAEKITAPSLFVVAENEELSNNQIVERVQQRLAQRQIPTKYHIIKGISHYGVYKEARTEAMTQAMAWFQEHLQRSKSETISD